MKNPLEKFMESIVCECGQKNHTTSHPDKIRSAAEALIERIIGILKDGGTSHTIMTIQHNGETYINERQAIRAIKEIEK